jgi:hypothetical protein
VVGSRRGLRGRRSREAEAASPLGAHPNQPKRVGALGAPPLRLGVAAASASRFAQLGCGDSSSPEAKGWRDDRRPHQRSGRLDRPRLRLDRRPPPTRRMLQTPRHQQKPLPSLEALGIAEARPKEAREGAKRPRKGLQR